MVWWGTFGHRTLWVSATARRCANSLNRMNLKTKDPDQFWSTLSCSGPSCIGICSTLQMLLNCFTCDVRHSSPLVVWCPVRVEATHVWSPGSPRPRLSTPLGVVEPWMPPERGGSRSTSTRGVEGIRTSPSWNEKGEFVLNFDVVKAAFWYLNPFKSYSNLKTGLHFLEQLFSQFLGDDSGFFNFFAKKLKAIF